MSDTHENHLDRREHRQANGHAASAIRTEGLTKVFGDLTAVDRLDLTVQAGEVFGFLGPNGAGKSTTIDILLGLREPTAGRAAVLGHDVRGVDTIRNRIGVLPEGYSLYDRLTGIRHLEFAIDWTDADTVPSAILQRVGLDSADASRPVGEYSTGMQQRLALGMALAGEPDLLILDEPSSGLDPHGIRRMRELVKEEATRGTTVFFSSHILGEVEAICDRVGILHEGDLVAVDTVDGLRDAVGAESQLVLRTDGPLATDLTTIEGITNVDYADAIARIDCRDPRAKVRAVHRLLETGTEIRDIGSEEASLEDVFTAYTTDGGRGGGDVVSGSPTATPEVSR